MLSFCIHLFKVPLTQNIFFAKMNLSLHLLETHCGHFFPFSNKSYPFIAFKTSEKPSIFCSRPSQKRSGSTPDLTSQSLCMHVYKELIQCKSVCDVKSVIDPLPFWLGREQKMLGFSQVLKPIKWQDLLEEGKNGRNAFRTGAKIHFSEKIVWV